MFGRSFFFALPLDTTVIRLAKRDKIPLRLGQAFGSFRGAAFQLFFIFGVSTEHHCEIALFETRGAGVFH